jgi:hypothetical protein
LERCCLSQEGCPSSTTNNGWSWVPPLFEGHETANVFQERCVRWAVRVMQQSLLENERFGASNF